MRSVACFARSPLAIALSLTFAIPFSGHVLADDANLSTVVVTGTRGQERTVTDSPVPVDVISAETLQKTGKSNLREALAEAVPSIATTQRGGAPISTVTMRGLGSAYVLFLVNGKRRHNNALLNWGNADSSGNNPVDLEQIPVAAIDHIEVLRDGAAAQYGSDAIAGVINIILKNSDKAGSSVTEYGGQYAGDGEKVRQSLNKGFELGDGGFFNATLEGLNQNATNRNEGVIGNVYPLQANGSADPREAGSPGHRYGTLNGTPNHEAYTLAFNSQLPVGDNTQLYSFGTYGQRHMSMGFTFRRPSSTEVLDSIYPDGYYPVYSERVRDLSLAVGAKGLVSGWDWDLSSTYGRNQVRGYAADDLNPSLGPVNAPTKFDLFEVTFSQWTQNLDLTRGFSLLDRPLQVSWGFEQRQERYNLIAGEPDAWRNGGYQFTSGSKAGRYADIGARGVPSTSAADEGSVERTTSAGYLDLGYNPTDRWYIGAAARGETFSDIDENSISGKLTTRFEFTPRLALRGTLSSGFRAPSLSQQGYGQTQNYVNVTGGVATSSQIKVARVDSALARALGSQDLKPEKSVNLSLGLVYKPIDDLSLTVDAYQIDIQDRVVKTSQLTGSAVSNLLIANGLSGEQSAQYFTNGVDTRTRGLDFVADYVQEYGRFGVVQWSAALNLNHTEITDIKSAPASLNALDSSLVYFDRQQQKLLTDVAPHNKLILGGNWLIDKFTVNLSVTRYGKVTTPQVLKDNDRTFGAKWITDLDIDYALTPEVSLGIGAQNLFDEYPDANALANAAGFAPYGSSPFGSDGGFYYTRLTVNF